MTTLVVHGTLARGSSWYQDSWEERGFLAGLQRGMEDASDWHDIWCVGGEWVWDLPAPGAVFEWTGLAEGLYRGIAAQRLVEYLNTVAELTDEPIRVIAHSHGCNVVKLASSLPALSPAVYIEQAVFLACPHFREDRREQGELGGLDQFDIGKVHQAYQKTGDRFRYRVAPDRFGRILNIYNERDEVQVNLAQSLSGGQVPLTGSFLENVLQQLSSGIHEAPDATRTDMDDAAAHLYEDLCVEVDSRCSGLGAHSVMHGALIGLLCGVWLNSGDSVYDVLQEFGDLPVLPADDTGG